MKKVLVTLMVVVCMIAAITTQAETVKLRNGLDGYTGTEDCMFVGNSNWNYGAAEYMRVYKSQYLPAIKFDVSMIPENAVITSATMKLLNASNSTGMTFTAHKFLMDFNFGTMPSSGDQEGVGTYLNRNYSSDPALNLTWAENGTDTTPYGPIPDVSYSTTDVATAAGLSANFWLPFDITDMVQEWVNDSSTNNGMFITYDGTALLTFRSSEYTSIEAFRPTLEIEYTTAVPEPGFAGLITALLAVLRFKRK